MCFDFGKKSKSTTMLYKVLFSPVWPELAGGPARLEEAGGPSPPVEAVEVLGLCGDQRWPLWRGHQRGEGGPRRGRPGPRALDVDHGVRLAAAEHRVKHRAWGQRVPGASVPIFCVGYFYLFLSEDLWCIPRSVDPLKTFELTVEIKDSEEREVNSNSLEFKGVRSIIGL